MNTRSTKAIRPLRNWSGFVRFTPQQVVMPGTLNELQRIVGEGGRAGRHIRVLGSGHSFTPLMQTEDILISLDNWQGIEEIDLEKGRVKVRSGTKLSKLGEALFDLGTAQECLGDTNVQSISGAISTGTHGTGINFGTLSTQVESVTLVTANGQLLECSSEENPDIFKAAQVSLGMLGVIAYVTLRIIPTMRLHFHGCRMSLDDCLKDLEKYKRENRHFSFLWVPHTDWVQAKFLNETTEPVSVSSMKEKFTKIVIKNWVYYLISEGCRLFPPLTKPISQLAAASIVTSDEVDHIHRIFATPRMVRFQEMEYNIPAEHLPAVMREIQQCVAQQSFNVHFPLECRFVRADDIWLSPAYQRDSAYVAVPVYRGMEYENYFHSMEEIFRRYQGRPHWAKTHMQTAESLSHIYPRWDDFQRQRTSLDPQGIFLNDYLRNLFGTATYLPSPLLAQQEQA